MSWSAGGERKALRLDSDFRIGRDEECAVRVPHRSVSRTHVEVFRQDGAWWVCDLQSTNGTYLDGRRVERARLAARSSLRLGRDGPELELAPLGDAPEAETGGESVEATSVSSPQTMSYYVDHYLEGDGETAAGARTMMIRRAFARVAGRRRRAYLAAVAAVALAAAGVGWYALRQHEQIDKQHRVAEDIFYAMKELELKLVALGERVAPSDTGAVAELAASRARFADLEHSYDRFLAELKIYGADVPERQRAVLRMARVFGECEVAMPRDLLTEVDRYVERWRGEHRLEQALARARENGYAPVVSAEMLRYGLPPQFFYVALQESDFVPTRCGPKTRWGIAKGPWQFVPSTAVAYGLKLGPLYLLPRPDPRDERHDFAKATDAAARYLRDLYDKDAQGSALLAIASYNWGENHVRSFINTLPATPRERNFWRLFLAHRRRIPRETYDYVLRIFSAAVIGENPRLFGFEFDNPLGRPATP